MKTAHLSSWNCKCGVSEYARGLVLRLVVDKRVFCNHLALERNVYGFDDWFVKRIFHVPLWDGHWDVDDSPVFEYAPDILHAQIQSCLYDVHWLNSFLARLKASGTKTVCTFHDCCLWPEFDWTNVDLALYHRHGVGNHLALPADRKVRVPIGIPARRIRIGSFGLGRNPDAEIERIAREHDIDFLTHNPIQKWLPFDDLLDFIGKVDAVVLWYPEVEAAGSSSALRTALAARRPVFCSNTTWFADATSPMVRKYNSLPELMAGIKAAFADPMIDGESSVGVAQLHETLYAKLLSP